MHQFHVSAAGNAFVGTWLQQGGHVPGREAIRQICAEHGADGFFAVLPSKEADVRIVYHNQDGSEDDVCGNALACTAMMGQRLGHGDTYSIEACGKVYSAFVDQDRVSVIFSDVPRTPALVDSYYFINTGVPHVVIPMPNAPVPGDVMAIGHHLTRNWPTQDQINVTMFGMERDHMHVATYEYGVWRVTGSCGTGILAAFSVARHLGKVRTHVTAVPPSRAEIEVYAASEGNALTFKTPVEILDLD